MSGLAIIVVTGLVIVVTIIVTILGRYAGHCVVITLLVNGEGYTGSWLGYSVGKVLVKEGAY